MNYKHVIAEAWEFTQNNKKMIIWYAFLPAVIETLAGIILLGYQFFAFKSSRLFENWQNSFGYVIFTTVLDVIRANITNIGVLIAAAIVIAVLYLLVPSICEGAIVQLIARKKNGQDVKTRHGLKYGLWSFLPLFEYSWLLRTISYVSVLTMMSSVARGLGMQVFYAFIPVFIFYAIVSVVLTMLFIYTEFFIIIDDRKVFESITKSCQLVVTHLEETIMLAVMMLIISIRILVQLLFVFLIPAIIFVSIYLFAATSVPFVGMIIGGVLGLALLYVAAYLSGTIHVFAATVWTFTFLEFTSEQAVSAREKEGT
jgi:hypothetical protein